MSAGVNEWHGIGNMTSDPELRVSDGGSSDRCMFSIAINRPGQDNEPTYIDCICWDKLAKQVADFGGRGRQVYVRGEIEVRRWEDESGARRKAFRIKAFTVRFLDRRPDRDDEERARPTTSAEDFSDLPF